MSTDKLYDDAIVLLKQLIATPSFSKEEDKTVSLIENFFYGQGVKSNRYLHNVWAVNKYFAEKKPTILLNSHHDTVKPVNQYSCDPFDPVIKNGKLYGLGSNDAGGCLVSLLAAFIHYYDKEDISYNIIMAATSEEEISGKNGIEALWPLLPAIDFAMVGEPTGLDLAVAEKGLLVLDCTAHGKAGHAARNEGENAIYKAMKDIGWFCNYTFPKRSALLGDIKMTVTSINSSNKEHNKIPEDCSFIVDIRITDEYTHEEILDVIRQHVDCKIAPRSMRLKPSSIAIDHPLVLSGKKLGRKLYGSATMSDAALMNVPVLKFGPGDSARSHTADEFIYLHEIKDGIEAYIQLLEPVLYTKIDMHETLER